MGGHREAYTLPVSTKVRCKLQMSFIDKLSGNDRCGLRREDKG